MKSKQGSLSPAVTDLILVRPMSRFLKFVAVAALVLAGFGYGCTRPQVHLPSDDEAKAYFALHRAQLDGLVESVIRDPQINGINASGTADGKPTNNPTHVTCVKRLRELGAQFLSHSGGCVEIFFWGSGCAFCHDSYKGFVYIADPSADMPIASKIYP